MATTIITPRNDGPYHIKGDFRITTQSGNEIEPGKDEVWLCRCGQSQNKPFCDGSHRKAEFRNNLDDRPQQAQTP
jgi:CDGSH-type Zn-finger protein